jgi:hypothetical protein
LDLSLELLSSMHGPAMHDLPIVRLLSQFDVLTSQVGHFLAQFQNLTPELPHEVAEISRLGSRG